MPKHGLLSTRPIYTPQLSDGIDFTGATDTSSHIEAFFARVPDGSTIRFPSTGTCGYVDRGTPLWGNSAAYQIVNRHNLTVDGNGCQFKALASGGCGDPHRFTFYVGGGSGITLEHLNITGTVGLVADNGTDKEFQSPIWCEGVNGLNIVGNTFQNSYGYYVNIMGDQNHAGGGTAATPCNNVLVDSNQMLSQNQTQVGSSTPPQGIALLCFTNLTISNNLIKNVGINGIDIEPTNNTWPCHHLTIKGNTFTNVNFAMFVCQDTLATGTTTHDITIDSNTNTTHPTACYPSVLVGSTASPAIDNLTVTNNTFNTIARGIELLNVTHCDVEHNTWHMFSGGCTGVGSPGAVMYGNQLPNGTVSNNFADGGQAAFGISDQNIVAGGGRTVFVTNTNNTGWPANNF